MTAQSSSEQDLGVQDPVRQHELADVVQQPRRVDELLLVLAAPDLRRQGAGVAGDGGGVACGRPVPQGEGLDQRAEHPELERRQLARAGVELLGAVLRAQQGRDQVLEDGQDQDQSEQGREAKVRVGDGERPGQRARGPPGPAAWAGTTPASGGSGQLPWSPAARRRSPRS